MSRNLEFVDLEEIQEPVQIKINQKKIIKKLEDFPEIPQFNNSKNKNDSIIKEDVKEFKNIPKPAMAKEKKKLEQPEELEKAGKVEKVSELEDVEELEELESLEKDNIDELIENIDDENDSIKSPGKINLNEIDTTLNNSELKTYEKKKTEKSIGEIFGVNRAKVFYNIDKQIYSSRSTSIFNKNKIKNIKKGLFLPATVAAISFSVLLIASLLLTIYFKTTSTSTLEDNFINDESLLAKIAKQKGEEAKLAGLQLQEERKRLEDERRKMESTINEELLKKEIEIENKYMQKIRELKAAGVSKERIEELKKEYEIKKEEAFKVARKERDEKIFEQNKFLEEKDEKLMSAMENLKKESKNYESELLRIKNELAERSKKEAKSREIANEKLSEIRKIENFNSTIYQLISGSMSDFNKGRLNSALQKLNAVSKYYNSRIDFVSANEELKNKMDTDIFFVETIKNLIKQFNSTTKFSEKDNNSAKQLFIKAEKYKKINKYNKAMKLYRQIIKDYPYSDYTEDALQQSIAIVKILNKEEPEKYDDELKEKFESDYKKYQKYHSAGNIETARRYYFSALHNAFDVYTNSSIYDFKKIEDEYIELLLQNSASKNNKYLEVKLEEQKKQLIKLENEKQDLIKRFNSSGKTSNLSTSQENEIISKYEAELKKKNKEIEEYKKYTKENEKRLPEGEDLRILKEYKEKLNAEREKSKILKKQLFDLYKKVNDLTK